MTKVRNKPPVERDIIIVLESCRWDSYKAAKTPNFDRLLGKASEARTNTNHTVTAFVDFVGYNDLPRPVLDGGVRLESKRVSFNYPKRTKSFHLFLDNPHFDRTSLMLKGFIDRAETYLSFRDNYYTHAEEIVAAAEDALKFLETFHAVLWFGETHYPYRTEYKSGFLREHKHRCSAFNRGLNSLSEGDINDMRQRQIAMIEHLDSVVGPFIEKFQHANITLTGDHGESFGENHKVFHGNDLHVCQFSVPFVEYTPYPSVEMIGKLPSDEERINERLKELGYF